MKVFSKLLCKVGFHKWTPAPEILLPPVDFNIIYSTLQKYNAEIGSFPEMMRCLHCPKEQLKIDVVIQQKVDK